ncbi:MAG: hypothetical protein ABIQ16_12980, partial [Polyangiaceae bacterium]
DPMSVFYVSPEKRKLRIDAMTYAQLHAACWHYWRDKGSNYEARIVWRAQYCALRDAAQQRLDATKSPVEVHPTAERCRNLEID